MSVDWSQFTPVGSAPASDGATLKRSPQAVDWSKFTPAESPDAATAADRASHSTLGDIGRSALGALETGAGEGVQGIGDVVHWGGASNLGKRIQAAGAREQANVSPQFAETTSQPILSRQGFNLTNIASKGINSVAGMAPQLVGTALASLAGPEAGIPVGAALFGTQGEAGGRNAGEQQVAALSDADIAKVPAYQQAIAAGATPDQARAQLSHTAATRGAVTSGLFGAGLGLAGEIPGVGALGRTVASKLTRPIGKTAAEIVGKGIGEGVGFGGINAAGQVASNVTNPVPTPALSNVGEAVAGGLLPGFALGAGRAGIAHLVRPAGPLGRAAQTAQETGAANPEPFPGAAPGSMADAANTLQRTVPGAAQAPPSTTEAQPTITRKMPPPPVPWVDAETGQTRTPAASEVVAAFHRMQDDQAQADANNVKLVTGLSQLSDAWGVPLERLKSLRKVAINERAKGITTNDAEQRAAEDMAQQSTTDAFQNSDRTLGDLNDQANAVQANLADARARLDQQQAARTQSQESPGGESATITDATSQPGLIDESRTSSSALPGAGDGVAQFHTETGSGNERDLSGQNQATGRAGRSGSGVRSGSALDDASAQPEAVAPGPTPRDEAAAPSAEAAPAPSEARRSPEISAAPAEPDAGQTAPAPSGAASTPVDQAAEAVPVSSSNPPKVGIDAETTPNVGENQGKMPEQEAAAQAAGAQASAAIDKNAAPPVQPERVVKASVPLGAGMSADGKTLYVDHRIPEVLDVPREDGSTAKVRLYNPAQPGEGGLPVHEGNEFPQMLQGKKYQAAHDENANAAEDAYYQQKYGVTRAAVDKALKPHLDAARAQGAGAKDIPADLDRTPYTDGGDEGLLTAKPTEASHEPAALATERNVGEAAAGEPVPTGARSGTEVAGVGARGAATERAATQKPETGGVPVSAEQPAATAVTAPARFPLRPVGAKGLVVQGVRDDIRAALRAGGFKKPGTATKDGVRFDAADRAKIEQALEQGASAETARYRELAKRKSENPDYYNTDLAKELFPEYNASNDARRENNDKVSTQASKIAHDAFVDRLKEPPKSPEETVFLMGGGTGSGKSELRPNEGIIYDSTQYDPAKAERNVRQVLDSGRQVQERFVYHDPESAFRAMLARGKKQGRLVNLASFIRTHEGAYKTIRHLQRVFKDDPRVRFELYDNTSFGAKTVDALPAHDYNDVEAKLKAILDAEYAAGHITEAEYKAVAGKTPSAAAGRQGTTLSHANDRASGLPVSSESNRPGQTQGLVNPETPPKGGVSASGEAKKAVAAAATKDQHTESDPLVIAHAIGAGEPFGDTTGLVHAARDAITKRLGAAALADTYQGNVFRSDDVTRAVRDGQYASVRDYAATLPTPITEDQIGIQLAQRAFEGVSHRPDERGRAALREYVRAMVDAWREVEAKVKDDPDALARAKEVFANLQRGYADRLKAYLHAESRVVSTMIAGGSKFPAARMEKRNRVSDKRASEASEFFKKLKSRMLKATEAPVDKTPAGELARARANLQQREARQERMKAANAAIRSKDDSKLRELGYSDAEIAKLKGSDDLGRVGYADYSLRNNNAEIRRVRGRVQQLEKLAEAANKGTLAESVINGVRVERNAADNRIRLRFDGKPAEDVRAALRGAGWKWSPKNEAWQRQLTGNAVDSAKRILGTLDDKSGAEPEQASPGFRRPEPDATNAGSGLPRARVEAIKDQISAKWGDNKPNVHVVDTPAEFPDSARTTAGFDMANHAYYDGRDIWLARSNLRSPQDVLKAMAHEPVHYALDRIMDQHVNGGWKKFTADIDRLRRDPALGSKAMRDAINEVERRYPGADADTFARELPAVMAERGVKNGILARVVEAIRAFLRRVMPGTQVTEKMALDLLHASNKYLHDDSGYRKQVKMVQAHAFSEAPDTFYSALSEAVNKAKGAPRSADAAAWKQWLDGAQRRGEFKGAEREWMGLDTWLDQHKGPITRAELNDFVRQNQVHVQEVVHGEPAVSRASDIVENEDGGFDIADDAGTSGDTKFGGYTLPGGKNYRELLLTLPQRDPLSEPERAELSDLTRRKQEHALQRAGVEALTTDEASRLHALQTRVIRNLPSQFRSNHFDEPNILAHVRFNDRTGPNGEKILHVEEVQSDLHQAGRKKGYASGERVPTTVEDVNGRWEVRDQNGDFITGVERAAASSRGEALEVARRRLRDNVIGSIHAPDAVPNAPFKKTEQWSMLAMKRVLRWAADHGYDKVTWTTGEQQAERYDLSHQVHSIDVAPTGADAPRVVDLDTQQGKLRLFVDNDGTIRSATRNGAQFRGRPIDEVLGKEVGNKVMEATSQTTLKGADLKLGGEGMKAFYDKMLPNELNKYAKQWGAKVGESRIGTAREHEMATALRDHGYDPAAVTDQQILSDNGGRRPAWLTDDDLEAIRDGSIAEVEPMRATVHSLDITPAMRESVRQGQPLFSKPEKDEAADPSKEPRAVQEDIQKAMRDSPDGVSAREKAKGWLRGTFEQFRPAMLGAIQTRHLLELMEDSEPLKGTGKQYGRSMQQLDADREQLMAGAPDAKEHPTDMLKKGAVTIAQELRTFAYGKGLSALRGRVRPEAQKLFDLMHQATTQRLDPSEAYEKLTIENAHGDAVPWTPQEVKLRLRLLRELMLQRGGDPWADREKLRDEMKYLRNLPKMERLRERNWPKLQADWQALPEEGKRLYTEARDWYSQYRNATEEALVHNIEQMDMPETYRRSLVNRMRLQFEEARREGVYFPLNRDGDFWIAFRDKDNNEGFKMFESARDFAAGEKRLRQAGFQIDAKGRRDHNMKAKDAPSGTFVRSVIDTLAKAKVSEKVQDEVYQTFLRSMPEMSMRKHSIHRRNIAGFSDDALRAFAKNSYHGAHQLARLRHAQDMQLALEAMKTSVDNWRRGENSTDEVKEPKALDVAKADALVGEMQKRHDWIMNPNDQQLANMMNSLGFVYYLGASPASALTNLTQVVQTTLPVLGAQHGWGKASRVLGAAWRDAARTGGHLDRTLKDPDERRAFLVMQQRGDFSKTQAHTLAGLAEGNVLQTSPVWSRSMNAISWMFHTAEVINREATGMAAYRLARAEGKNFNEAVAYAGETNANTQFDYSAGNRPRYMQGNVARIALQFKNYSVGMTWLFYRNLFQAMKGETPEVRQVARRTVTGILGMTAILAGTTGLPVYNAVKMAANAANTLFGDDDEPWNFDDAFHRWLADNLGPDAARLIAEGPTNYLTGANLASRTSLANLWIQNDDQRLEGADAYHALLENLAGPIGGITSNFYVGAEDVRRGHLERGVERMLPTSVKNSIKALRYAHEGVNSMRGDPIVPDVSSPELFLQAIGFQPAKVANQYRINTAMQNYTGEIKDQRINLMNAYAMAVRSADDGDRGAAMRNITAFNQAHPEVAITRPVLQSSLRQRARLSAQASHGIILSKRLAPAAQAYVGATQ